MRMLPLRARGPVPTSAGYQLAPRNSIDGTSSSDTSVSMPATNRTGVTSAPHRSTWSTT